MIAVIILVLCLILGAEVVVGRKTWHELQNGNGPLPASTASQPAYQIPNPGGAAVNGQAVPHYPSLPELVGRHPEHNKIVEPQALPDLPPAPQKEPPRITTVRGEPILSALEHEAAAKNAVEQAVADHEADAPKKPIAEPAAPPKKVDKPKAKPKDDDGVLVIDHTK